jgi:ubiquinol-cytochrome c reductase cytochrome b subunit
MSQATTERGSRKPPATALGKAGDWADERFTGSMLTRRALNKVFPDNWTFMMGEIALYSFIILLLTGTYLSFFYDPSMTEVHYDGSYSLLRGVEMTRAYDSTLDISFDIRGGLLMRQIHHWAALLFVAAMVAHMLRNFFTGSFRKPREVTWLLGVTLLTLGILEGFAGYSLPDDLLSGTGLRIAHAIMLSIPVVGTWVAYAVFGAEFPGNDIIPRLYITHVLLIPGIILIVITVHIFLVVKLKHTQFPGPGRQEDNVVGERLYPSYGAKGGGFFFLVFAVVAALGGLFQINPVWLYGPYNPAQVSAGTQPDWYMGFLDGSIRLFPAWEIRFWDYTISPIFWPCVILPGIMFTLLAAYPFIEAKMTNDRAHHHLLQRPRDVPVRTSLGAMALTFYIVLLISGGNDIIANKFDISLNAMTWWGRISLIVLPPLAYVASYTLCLGLQRHDREVLEHGVETGIIKRLPSGEFIEVHQPLGPVDEHGHGELQYAGFAVPKRMNRITSAGRKVKGFLWPVQDEEELRAREQIEALEAAEDLHHQELADVRHHHDQLAGRPKDPEL